MVIDFNLTPTMGGGRMGGQRVGYIRVSTFDQNPDRQLEGIEVDRVFTDHASGKDVVRPERKQERGQHGQLRGYRHVRQTMGKFGALVLHACHAFGRLYVCTTSSEEVRR